METQRQFEGHNWSELSKQKVRIEEENNLLEFKISSAIEQLKKIVCCEGCDAGVVYLDNDGPTYYDEETKCETYKHTYFSPLGDALIELYHTLIFKE